MINFVVPDDQLTEETATLATRLATGLMYTVYQAFLSFWRVNSSHSCRRAEYFADCASRRDFKEGVTAFIEKREAKFTR